MLSRGYQRYRSLLLWALVFSCGAVSGAEPGALEAATVLAPAVAQAAAPGVQEAEIAAAIRAGTVLEGMTMEQVLSARGEPIRKEVIPPDAELWHYVEGEVAFSQGKVSYVALLEAATPPAPSHGATREGAAAEDPTQRTLEEPRGPITGRVHTPGDGFLALRSEPTIRSGRRILKIPHGTLVTLGECVSRPSDGRWCRTSYKGQRGWVFDRYLVR